MGALAFDRRWSLFERGTALSLSARRFRSFHDSGLLRLREALFNLGSDTMQQPGDARGRQEPKSAMTAVVTTGAGGYDRLEYTSVPTPQPGHGEVLISVRAAGVNNTDINTRLGWYAGSVRDGTNATRADDERPSGGWKTATPFPLIQGADCCGIVVSVGDGVDDGMIGRRVLVRPCMRVSGFTSMDTTWLGSDFDGAFAQFVKVPAREAFPVKCAWSDAELATIPCAYGTAENMVHRAAVTRGERVVVPGASGGVGSALVQLLKLRGAEVIALTSVEKANAIRQIGADRVLVRDDDPIAALGLESVDVVIDNVAGAQFGTWLKLLKRGGRYASSGAIAGPIVELDMRDLYLKDITLIGCTAWDEPVFPNLIALIETDALRPLLSAVYPLAQIAAAQEAFLRKAHVGKIVLVPPV
jgi:NADPH:quinone reductase-like Zn-dependent oxidoreductase